MYNILRVFVVALMVHFSASGQIASRFYFDKEGYQTDSTNSYWFMESSRSEGVTENISYYTATGKIRTKEYSDSLGTKTLHYHLTESLKAEVILVKKGSLLSTTMFYPNGKRQAEFSSSEIKPGDKERIIEVLNYWDSLGHPIVVDGNGKCQCILTVEEVELYIESGDVKNKLKEGNWKGVNKEGKTFEEQYSNGKLINGTMQDVDGKTYTYTEVMKQAEPSGGYSSFFGFLSRTMKYPAKARRLGIEGTSFVAFIVEKDGELTNESIIKGVGAECDAEAIRVVKAAKNWSAGVLRGKKVRQRFVLPLKFKLQ